MLINMFFFLFHNSRTKVRSAQELKTANKTPQFKEGNKRKVENNSFTKISR